MSATRCPAVYACGVEVELCTGSVGKGFNHSIINSTSKIRVHASPEGAFNCKKNSLLRKGYTMLGTREFRPPDGGPILILTKPSRFGARLRMGKEGSRNMPRSGGCIIIG